jgi:hypothetical protein
VVNLYLISQDINNDYDTYDSAVVCAENEHEARCVHPGEKNIKDWKEDDSCYDWVIFSQIKGIKVEFIGVADKSIKKGVVIVSFNAG